MITRILSKNIFWLFSFKETGSTDYSSLMILRQSDPNWGPSMLGCFYTDAEWKQLVRVEGLKCKTLRFIFGFSKNCCQISSKTEYFVYRALLLTTIAISCILLQLLGSTGSPGAEQLRVSASAKRLESTFPAHHAPTWTSCHALWYLHPKNQVMPSFCKWLGRDPLSAV